MLLLFIRAMPRVEHHPVQEAVGRGVGKIARFLHNIPTEKIDQWFTRLLEKFLRKTKVVILKIDNKVTIFLERVRAFQKKGNGDGKQAAMENMLKDFESLKDADDAEG